MPSIQSRFQGSGILGAITGRATSAGTAIAGRATSAGADFMKGSKVGLSGLASGTGYMADQARKTAGNSFAGKAGLFAGNSLRSLPKLGQYASFGGGVVGGLTKTALKTAMGGNPETAREAGLSTSVTPEEMQQELANRGILSPTATQQIKSPTPSAPRTQPLLRAPQIPPSMATSNIPSLGARPTVSPMQQSQRMLASAMQRGSGSSGGTGGISSEVVGMLSAAFDKFAESVQTLKDMQISVKLDATNINVNFNGASFLDNLTQEVRNGVLREVKNEIETKLVQNSGGEFRFNT
jgi:hypothetical protein